MIGLAATCQSNASSKAENGHISLRFALIISSYEFYQSQAADKTYIYLHLNRDANAPLMG